MCGIPVRISTVILFIRSDTTQQQINQTDWFCLAKKLLKKIIVLFCKNKKWADYTIERQWQNPNATSLKRVLVLMHCNCKRWLFFLTSNLHLLFSGRPGDIWAVPWGVGWLPEGFPLITVYIRTVSKLLAPVVYFA